MDTKIPNQSITDNGAEIPQDSLQRYRVQWEVLDFLIRLKGFRPTDIISIKNPQLWEILVQQWRIYFAGGGGDPNQ